MAGQGGRLLSVDHYINRTSGYKLHRTRDWVDEADMPKKFGRLSQAITDEWGAQRRALLSDVEDCGTAKESKELSKLYREGE